MIFHDKSNFQKSPGAFESCDGHLLLFYDILQPKQINKLVYKIIFRFVNNENDSRGLLSIFQATKSL